MQFKLLYLRVLSRLLSISLSFVIIIQSFGVALSDISQIDEFIEHAQFHSAQYGDNVLVFISKHYGDLKAEHDKEHQEEKEEHEKLPFQQHSQLSSIQYFVLNTEKISVDALAFSDFKADNFRYLAPSSALYSDSPFQPPRHS
jgi:hypothetical protein